MVAEPWLLKMGNHVSSNLKNSLLLHQNTSNKKHPSTKTIKKTIGILSFEVANVMSKLVHLHTSVSDQEISKLKNEIIKSEGVKKLVSCDESYLLELAYGERLDDLNRVAEVVSRLGKKCTEPALLGFEHVYGDIISRKIEVKDLGFLVKDMEGMIRRLERYVGATSNLYGQIELLNELEQATKKFHLNPNEESRRAFEQKLTWQRQDVKHLKNISLWNQTYDKVVELLARTVCTLYARICVAFGNEDAVLRRNYSRSVVSESNFSVGLKKVEEGVKIIGRVENRGFNTELSMRRREIELVQHQGLVYPCGPSPARILMECLSLSTSASRVDDNDSSFNEQDSYVLNRFPIRVPSNGDALKFSPKSQLASHATPSTIGGSALALHYANVVIIIEKLLRYPNLVGDEARDDLYQMFPTSLRKSLRRNLKSYFKNFAIYDAPLAHDWKDNLDGILKWLAPLAHNMIRWQNERNFEQHQIVKRTNVLLMQTLYFADRQKTEETICELLVGLNYICRYEHQQNALLDCASSFDFSDWMEWQSQCQSNCLN